MNVRCKKCHYNFQVAEPVGGGEVIAVCPRCGNRFPLDMPQQPAAPAQPVEPAATVKPPQPVAPAAPVQQVQPVQQAQPVQTAGLQLAPQQQAPQPPVIIYSGDAENKGKKSNLVPILLGVIVGLLIVCAIILFAQKKTNEAAPVEETVAVTSPAEERASVREAPAAPAVVEEVAPAEEPPMEANVQFSPRYTSSGVSSFCELPFVIESQVESTGYSVDNFQDMLRKGRVTSGNNMIMYENSDGVRYQFFFDESPHHSTALLTGIAISRQVSSPYDACMQMDATFENNSYNYYGHNLYRGSSGLVFSPGYKGKRVYCYIYMPNAPNKEAAPRG